MITCPNKNLQEWKDLVAKVGETEAYWIWNQSEGKLEYDETDLKSVISKLKDILLKQKAIFSKKSNSKKFVSDIDNLLESISKEGKEFESVMEYIADSNVYINQLFERFNELKEKLDRNEHLLPKERNDALNLINKIKELSSSYNLLDELDLVFNDNSSSPIGPEQELLSRTIRRKNKLKAEYEEAGKNLVTDWLYQQALDINEKLQEEGKSQYILSKDKIKSELEMASSDISFFTAMFGSAISSTDPITALAAKAIKEKMTQANTQDLDTFYELVEAYEEAGTPSIEDNKKYIHEILKTEYVMNDGVKQKNVRKVKAIITKYKTNEFENAKSEFFEKLGPRPLDPKESKAWTKAVALWFKENQSIVSNAHDILKSKEQELSPEDYDAWFKENTVVTENTTYRDGRSKLALLEAENPNIIAGRSGNKIYLFSGEFTRPSDKYINEEYKKFKDDVYYQKLLNTYEEANNKLPKAYRLKHGMLPQIVKNSNEKTLGERFSKANLADNLNVTAYDTKYSIQTLSGEEYKQIPIQFIKKIDEELVSENLLESVLKFSQMSNNYRHMSEIKANVDMLMSLVNDRTVVETNSKGEQIIDAVTKRLRLKSSSEAKKVNERLKNFIDMAYYGQEEIKNTVNLPGSDTEININKVTGKLQYLTALSSMAGNVTSGISNVIWGNYQAFAQSIGGKNYTKGEWTKALGHYTANIPLYMNDLSKRIGKSKDNQLVEIFDAIQGEFKDSYGNRVSNSAAKRLFSTNSLFFTNNAGEHQIQVTSMIAILKHHKVKNAAGEEISLYDAYELDGHRYKLKPGIKFSEKDKFNVMNEIHAINKKLHGVYNNFDKPELQRYWYGKMALMFRKHIYSGIINRYGKERLDIESGEVEEGYYRTFMSKFVSDLREFGFSAVTNYKNYSPEQRVAFTKTMRDALFLTGSILLAGAIGGDDDKKKTWFQNEMILQLRRFNADIKFYTFLTKDTWRILNNPTVTQNTIGHITDFVDQLVTGPLDVYERKTGLFSAGESKLKAKFMKMTPIVRQINSLLTPEEQIKIYNK